MDTNQEELGVSLDDVAGLLGDDLPDDEIEKDEDEEQGNLQAEESEEDDSEEVDIDGKSYKVPKELKDMVLMHKDYTQKTQKVAEDRRAVEERAQALQQREQVMAQTFDKAVEFREVQNRLAKFEQIDWQGLAEQDPVQAQKLHFQYAQLQRDAQSKWNALQQANSQVEQLTAEQRQKQLQQAEKDLKDRLPDFGPQIAEKILGSTLKAFEGSPNGPTQKELESADRSWQVVVLYEAMKWRELQAQKPKAMRAVADAPRAIKPAAAQPKRTNQAASERLRKSGRMEDLASFL